MVRNLGLEVLELFAEAQSPETYIGKDYSRVRHDRAKREWRMKNKEKQRLYSAKHYAKKTGKPMPPMMRSKVELFWDGDGWYIAKPKDSELLGGPFTALHEAWKQADLNYLEVMQVCTTRGDRSYRG